MRKIIIAAAAVLVVGVGAGGGWWVYTHLLRSPVASARELLARGDVRAAQLELRNAVRKDPANADAHFELGQLQLQFGDAVAAEKELKAARAAGYHGPRVTPLLARSYLAQDKFRDLLKEFSPAGLPPAEAASVLVSRSLAQIALRDGPSARASAITAERLAPTLAEAPMAIARIAAATGDRGQALLKVEEALKLDPRLIEGLGLKADLLRGQGDLVQAMATLDTAVQVAPYLSRVRLARARALLIAGEDTRAKQDVEAALKVDGKNTLGLYLQSLLLIRARDWPAANVSLQKIQPVLSQVPRGEYYYALAKSNVNQTEQAVEAVGHYLGRNKSDADGWRLLARIKLQMGRPAEASEALKRANELGGDQAAPASGSEAQANPDEAPASSPESLTRLASLQLESGDTGGAEHDLDQSLETQPTRADTGAVQVLSALATGDVERAQAALERLQRQPRALPEVVGNLTGLVRMAQLDFDGARAAWADTVKAAPTAVPPRVNLARVLALRGQPADAERVLGEILDTQPANRAALRTLVEILVSENKLDRAIAVVRAARKASPNTLGLLVTEAALHARQGDFAAAYSALDEVALEQALSPLLLTTRAQIQLAQDHKPEAADSYRQILINTPGDQITRRRLIDLMVALDKGDEAQKLTDYGLALAPGNSALLQVSAMLTYRLKGIDAALASVDKMLQDPINLPTARLLKGGLYMTAKRYADAAAAYGAEMGDMPFTTLVISQAGALRAAGRADDATALLRDWVARQPDPAVAESLASLDIEAHRLDEAEKNLGGVLATRPNDAVALNNLAWIYSQRNDKRARAMAQKAYLLAPGAQTADTLGWIVTQQGDAELGTMLLRRAAQQLTSDPTVQYHLAAGLKASGQRAEATALVTALLAKAGAFDERAHAQQLLAELTDQTAK
jgi:cellulose synthase operon protein C